METSWDGSISRITLFCCLPVTSRPENVLVPGLAPVRDECFRVGASILLRRPGGLDLKATIDALELPHPNPNNELVIILRYFGQDDVPIGTEVWSI